MAQVKISTKISQAFPVYLAEDNETMNTFSRHLKSNALNTCPVLPLADYW